MKTARHRSWGLVGGGLAFLLLVAGCGGSDRHPLRPRAAAPRGLTPAEIENRAAAVRYDPVAYLHRVAARCRGLTQYTLTLVRQERRGLFGRLAPPEHVQCWFRREPFSVRMKWLDTDIKHDETVYVEGQYNNQVRFVTRWWVPPLRPPPGINTVGLGTPVAVGETKWPLRDFGLERMMERTLESMAAAGPDVIVTYAGPEDRYDGGALVHHLHLEYSAARYKVPIQELYVDVATDLPAGTVLKHATGELDGQYEYLDLNTDVRLTDADFLLTVERSAVKPAPGASSRPAPRPARRNALD